jgi:aspartyl-tRNA(Asn)/glutamyl-tRNA(Gln) amidotransferase subunit C
MFIDLEEVRRIARLAAIELTEAEERQMSAELSAIVEYIDVLRGVDVSAVAPEEASAVPLLLHDDVPAPSLPSGTVEDNAPQFIRGHFVVPRVFGGE